MGFFSSIGSVLGGAVGSVFGPVGTVIGAGLGNAAGSALGGSSSSDKRYDQQMAFAQSQDQFSRDYVQNAIQWRVEDAKKAGVHPMAALGISSPQYSAASLPSIPSDTQSIDPMEFGQSLNYAATKAKDRKQQAQMVDLQMRGLELDNEYKQAQIDALKVDTLASSIASNQAWQSPANPTLNAKESQGDSPIDNNNTFGNRSYNLYSLGRFGDMVLTALNPDIADSLTESQISHLSATLMRDIEYYRNPRIKMDAFKHLSKAQQQAVVDGRATFEYVPAIGGFMLTYPKRRYPDGSVGGKLRFE